MQCRDLANIVVNNFNDTPSLTCAPNHGFLHCVTERGHLSGRLVLPLSAALKPSLENYLRCRLKNSGSGAR